MRVFDKVLLAVALTPLVLAGAGCVAPGRAAGNASVAASIQTLVKGHMAAMTRGDVEAVLRTLHPEARTDQGPLDRPAIAARIGQRMAYELVRFRLLAVDGDLAVARLASRITPPDGQPPREANTLQLYLRSHGEWRIWRAIPLPAGSESGVAADK